MRTIQPIQYKWRSYYLWYGGNRFEVEQPDNWAESERELARSEQYHGMIVTISDDISFSGTGSELIQAWYNLDGVTADILLEEYEMDSETDEKVLVYAGTIDFSSYSVQDNVVSVRINSEALQKKLTSRYETEININNDETLDGSTHGLGPVQTDQINLFDRVLYGENTLRVSSRYEMPDISLSSPSLCVLFNKNDAGYFAELPRVYEPNREVYKTGNLHQNLLFFNQQGGTVYVDVEITVTLSLELPAEANNTGTVTGQLTMHEVVEPLDDDLYYLKVQDYSLGSWASIPTGVLTEKTFKYSGVIPVPTRHQLTLHLDFNGWLAESGIEKKFWVKDASAYFGGNVTYDATKCQAYMPFNFFERMTRLMGAKSFVSSYLKDSRLALLTGFMVRNVPDQDVSFSFQKLFQSYDSMEPLGLATKGQSVIIEKREYFFQEFLVYDFEDNIGNVIVNFERPMCYSEVKIGFQTSNFTKESAVTEYSVRTIWTTPVDSFKQELNMVSNIQGSSNTIETLRRVQYDPDTERTWTRRGDSTWFFLDLEDNSNTPRTWEADFQQVPVAKNRYGNYEELKNAFSAYNLRLTPMNILRKHGKWISHGYSQFMNKLYSFSSSTGNTGMRTLPIGETEVLGEDDSLEIIKGGNPHFISETITFTIEPINFYKILTAYHSSGVQNFYGTFAVNHNNQRILGYMKSYKPETFEVTLHIKSKTDFE